jgi:hypothetical protein
MSQLPVREGISPPLCARDEMIDFQHVSGFDSALANQAANGRPVSKSSKTFLGNCTNSGSAAEFTKYWARQR